MKSTWIAGLLVLVLALLVAGTYFARPGNTPVGQPLLVEMDPSALSALQTEFNRPADSLRVILLLSPT